MDIDTKALVFNGIDGCTGEYLLPPQPPGVISAIVRNEPLDPRHSEELRRWWQRISVAHLAPTEGVDPKDLAQAGWGVIFAHDAMLDGCSDPVSLRRRIWLPRKRVQRFRPGLGAGGSF